MSGSISVDVERPVWDEFVVSFDLPPLAAARRSFDCSIELSKVHPDSAREEPTQLDATLSHQGARQTFRYRLGEAAYVRDEYSLLVTVTTFSMRRQRHVTVTGRQTFTITPEYTRGELRRLLEKAAAYVDSRPLVPCHYFYRDKTRSYYKDKTKVEDDVMKVYLKDENGDPRSPINGRIKGLFFSVNVDANGSPLVPSQYGDVRVSVPCDYFLSSKPRLYFADFYCMKSPDYHYVSLVMTLPGSATDDFCRRSLVQLDWCNNPLLCYNHLEDQMYVVKHRRGKKRGVVEVFYTEDVDVGAVVAAGGDFDPRVKCYNRGRHRGVPKDSGCTVCNVTNVAPRRPLPSPTWRSELDRLSRELNNLVTSH